MSDVTRITVTTRVEVPASFAGDIDTIRSVLTNGITHEVNAFFEDLMPGVHVTYCGTEVEA